MFQQERLGLAEAERRTDRVGADQPGLQAAQQATAFRECIADPSRGRDERRL